MPTLTQAQAKKEVQRLWVAGTVGAFFAAAFSSIPVHINLISSKPDWLYTLDLSIRYGYLLWLLVYFFMSNIRIDQSDNPKDLKYDLIQSVLSLTVLVALDFGVPGQGLRVGASYAEGITVANAAIIIIAGLALKWFPVDNLGGLRIAGLVLAGMSIIVAWTPFSAVQVMGVVAVLELILIGVLAVYVHRRWPRDSTSSVVVAPYCGKPKC
jgi:hypothetical protein